MTQHVDSDTLAYAVGFAELVATAPLRGGLQLSWDIDGDYTATEIGIYLMAAPADRECVVLAPYTLTRHPTLTSNLDGLNITVRSGTRVTRMWAIRDGIRDHLHGRFPIRLSTGVHVAALTFGSGASLGRDNDKRWSWSDNWTARTGSRHT